MVSSDGPGSQQSVFPIQSLNPEILAQIFIFYKYWHSSPWRRNRDVLVLSNTCSSWRALAIATPSLWATFFLYINSTHLKRDGIESIVEHIHTWLGRSGAQPLTIDFTCDCCRDESIQACEALALYASRWETMKIRAECIPFYSWPDLGEASLLRSLHIIGKFDNVLHGVPFNSAPRLTNLLVKPWPRIEMSFPPPPNIAHMPWHQLTTITFFNKTQNNRLLEILRSCSRLEFLEASVVESKSGAVLPFSRIKLEMLKALDLNIHDNCDDFLESLSLPALSTLKLTDYNRQDLGPILVDFLNRSQCELDNLTLVNFMFAQNGLFALLGQKSCQTLTNLGLDYCRPRIGDEILERLRFVDVDGGVEAMQLCPNLARLSFLRCYSMESSPGLLGKMVLSRCSEGRPLSVFNLVTTRDIAEEDMGLLELARKRGLEGDVYVCEDWSDEDR